MDWDGLVTFFLTLLLIPLTLGIPLILSLRKVLDTARTAPDTTDAEQLLVFGKRLQSGKPDEDYRLRLQKAARLMLSDPARRLLLLGGAARPGEISESVAGERLLLNQGVPPSRMRREEKSQNTLENLRHARDLLMGGHQQPVALISNRYHLARIQTMADSLRLSHQLCAAEPQFRLDGLLLPRLLPRLLMEAWYILWFRTGKRWARLIRSQRMLDRVT